MQTALWEARRVRPLPCRKCGSLIAGPRRLQGYRVSKFVIHYQGINTGTQDLSVGGRGGAVGINTPVLERTWDADGFVAKSSLCRTREWSHSAIVLTNYMQSRASLRDWTFCFTWYRKKETQRHQNSLLKTVLLIEKVVMIVLRKTNCKCMKKTCPLCIMKVTEKAICEWFLLISWILLMNYYIVTTNRLSSWVERT